MTHPEHVVCQTSDLRILDARLADLAQAATLARLPAAPMEARAMERLRIATNRKDPVSGAVIRTCPNTGARLTIALWNDPASDVPGGVELELVDPSRHDVLVLTEPLRLDGSGPNLSSGDAPWLDHVHGLLTQHRDRMAIPESQRTSTPFARVSRLVSVAARSAHRGGVDAALRSDGRTDGPVGGTTIALAPPSPYGPGSMRAATRGPQRIQHDVQPASAIRSDLATLGAIVSIAIARSGILDRIALDAYGTLHHPVFPEDRDPMQRLRDAADFAVDRIDLALPRHVTTLAADFAGRLAITTDDDVTEQERMHVARALRIGAEAAARSQLDEHTNGYVMMKDPVTGTTFLRCRHQWSVQWIVSNGPEPKTEIVLAVTLAGTVKEPPKGTPNAAAIAAELSHLADGLESARAGEPTQPTNIHALLATTRIASIVDALRDPDRTLHPLDLHVVIDPFGNVDAHTIPVFQSSATPVTDDPEDLGLWIGHGTGCGILRRGAGAALSLRLEPASANARYVPDDPTRTDSMERLRIESERIVGTLPPLSDRLLAQIS